MRIVLLYPPPWKIAEAGEMPDPADGPPDGYLAGDLDPDFWQIPYGLLSLGAQALRAGHQVKVYNLSSFTWSQTLRVIGSLSADLWGLSCWTANRRGVALVAAAIKQHHPASHVVVGGPHATPLAKEMLEHHAAIDTVTIGESEEQFLDLARRLATGASPQGIAGTAYRAEGRVVVGTRRPAIADLDLLASVQDYFDTHILMTARGCPWQCTFCGADTTWGRGFRGHSVKYVLDALEHVLPRLPVKMLQIKDDTFTVNKQRVLELCRGIRARGLRFLWSCDTRVDVLNEELLREMRLAGCQRLSLGVESGSPHVLRLINKKITPEQILASTAKAKAVGIQVRFYMMLGNRGETAETFRESLAFLERAQPHQYLFSCLSIYPGTDDFADAEASGWLDRECFFTERFQEYKCPFDASETDTALMNDWFREHKGLRTLFREGVPECQAILERLGDHHAAHLDLAGAYYRVGELERAAAHVRRGLELGYPLPGLAHNTLACIAYQQQDLATMQAELLMAAKADPQHPVLIQNVQRARAWFAERGASRGLPLELTVSHDFQLLERTRQPTLPGELPEDFAAFPPPFDAPAETSSMKSQRPLPLLGS